MYLVSETANYQLQNMAYRLERVNELLKEELGEIFLREIEFPKGALATITRVETSLDLMSAKVFISVFPDNLVLPAFKILNSQIYFLQQKINHKLDMRPIPRLVFCQEKETARAGRVEELLEEVKERPVEKTSKKR